MLPKGPGLFDTCAGVSHWLPRFEGCFQRYARFGHVNDSAVRSQSFRFALENSLGAYGYGSLIEIFSECCASILAKLRAKPKAAAAHWKGSNKLDPEPSLTFTVLRASAKRAGMIPESTASGFADEDPSVWPDIAIRQALSRPH